jgi:hypothetical protein
MASEQTFPEHAMKESEQLSMKLGTAQNSLGCQDGRVLSKFRVAETRQN